MQQVIRFSLLIALLGVVFSPLCGATAPQIYKIGKEEIRFFEVQPGTLLVTENCLKQSCQALENSKQASTIGLSSGGGANPGALICRKLNGTVVIGTDARRNELSFCRFTDRSMMANSSLYSQALDNDLKKHR